MVNHLENGTIAVGSEGSQARNACEIEDIKRCISEEDFREYESVRESGQTNMFAVRTVSALSGIELEDVQYIMKKYDLLTKAYPGVRK